MCYELRTEVELRVVFIVQWIVNKWQIIPILLHPTRDGLSTASSWFEVPLLMICYWLKQTHDIWTFGWLGGYSLSSLGQKLLVLAKTWCESKPSLLWCHVIVAKSDVGTNLNFKKAHKNWHRNKNFSAQNRLRGMRVFVWIVWITFNPRFLLACQHYANFEKSLPWICKFPELSNDSYVNDSKTRLPKEHFFTLRKIKRSHLNPTRASVSGTKQKDYMWHYHENRREP